MSKFFKASLLVASALLAPTPASAAMVDSADAAPAAAAAKSIPAPATLDFLAEATVQSGITAADAVHEHVTGGHDGDDPQRVFKLGFSRPVAAPPRLRGDSDLFLWSLLGIVHAQRHSRHFDLADRGVEFVLTYHAKPPSTVPLPGALWLFVMGALGLAGTRITGVGRRAGAERTRAPVLPISGAMLPA